MIVKKATAYREQKRDETSSQINSILSQNKLTLRDAARILDLREKLNDNWEANLAENFAAVD